MKIFIRTISLSFFLNLIFSFSSYAQDKDENLSEDAIKLYIDCRRCDVDYIKREIKFVNYVRDSKEADLHLLMSDQDAANGGDEYSFYFLGQRKFAGKNDTLKFVSLPDDTWEQVRAKMVRTIKIGLIQYVSKTPLIEDFKIDYTKNGNGYTTNDVKDKWNNWIFDLRLRGSYSENSTNKSINENFSLDVDKIDDKWKLESRLGNSFRYSRYEDEDTIINIYNRSYYFRNLTVRSINDHWSVGLKTRVGSSTFSNYDLYAAVYPAIEFNIFPYSESSLKQVRFLFSTGYKFHDYIDTTRYFKMKEHLIESEIEVAFEIKQKWGSIDTDIEYAVYWHDPSKFAVDINSFVNIKIVKGLSVFFGGGAGIFRNEINIAKGDYTIQDIILEQNQIASEYEYWFTGGLSYTFGSIYNNIVNPRFD